MQQIVCSFASYMTNLQCILLNLCETSSYVSCSNKVVHLRLIVVYLIRATLNHSGKRMWYGFSTTLPYPSFKRGGVMQDKCLKLRGKKGAYI